MSRKLISTICLISFFPSLFYNSTHFIRSPTTYYFMIWSLFSSKVAGVISEGFSYYSLIILLLFS